MINKRKYDKDISSCNVRPIKAFLHLVSQVDQNGVVYDSKMDRKSCKNGAFTAVYGVKSASFQSVLHRIIGRRITDRIVSVS
jgi:hypothetical protein